MPGRPPLPTRLMAGLAILKHTLQPVRRGAVRALGGEPLFPVFLRRGVLPARAAVRPLVDDALAPAHGRGAARGAAAGEPVGCGQDRAMKPADSRVIVDTTVQPKNVMFPTDAKLMHRARERLVRLAKSDGLDLRQILCAGRQAGADQAPALCPRQAVQARQPGAAHAHTYLGRVIRDIGRKIAGEAGLEAVFARPLSLAAACASSASASAAARSTPCTRPRSNASARARRTRPTSSASRSRSPPR